MQAGKSECFVLLKESIPLLFLLPDWKSDFSLFIGIEGSFRLPENASHLPLTSYLLVQT